MNYEYLYAPKPNKTICIDNLSASRFYQFDYQIPSYAQH